MDIFSDVLILYPIPLLQQVKWSVINSNKHSIYGLPHKLPNDLRLKDLENWKISGKSQNFIEL